MRWASTFILTNNYLHTAQALQGVSELPKNCLQKNEQKPDICRMSVWQKQKNA